MFHITLNIIGQKAITSKIVKKEFKLGNTIPAPEDAKSFSYNPYEPSPMFDTTSWFVQNWGIKKELDDSYVKISKNKTEIKFETVENLPIPWLKKTSELYSELEFNITWYEDEYPRCGKIRAINGNIEGYRYKDGIIADDFMKENYYENWEEFHEEEDSEEDSNNSFQDNENITEIIDNNYFDNLLKEKEAFNILWISRPSF